MTLRPLVSVPTIVLLTIVLTGVCIAGYMLAVRGTQVRPEGKENPLFTWVRRLLISSLMVFSLMGPAVQAEEIQTTTNIEIVFAVDRTGSMAAEDMPGGESRMSAVRKDIIGLIDATAGSRYAVVTWDSTARVELPFTTDSSAARSLAEVMHQEITEFSRGSSLERPVSTLKELLASAKEQRPENVRYLVVFTDGEPTDSGLTEAEKPEWAELKPYLDGGAVFGYGTEQGGPMRKFVPGQGLDGQSGEYMTDPNAAPGGPVNEKGEPLAISRIDKESLNSIADQLGVGLYINPTPSQIEEIGSGLISQAETLPDRTGSRHRYRYVVWIPAIAISLLLVWEVTADAREVSRMRRTGAI